MTSIVEKIFNAIIWAIGWALAWMTFGLSLLAAKIFTVLDKKGPDDEISDETIKNAANQLEQKKNEIERAINHSFYASQNWTSLEGRTCAELTNRLLWNDGTSYKDQVFAAIKQILLTAKLQELKALEGLFTYDEN